MTSGNGLSVTYAAFNKPQTITRGTASVSFDHDPEHQRYAQHRRLGRAKRDPTAIAWRLLGGHALIGQPALSRRLARLDGGDVVAEALARRFDIEAALDAEPEFGRGAEVAGEPQRRVRRDRGF